MTQPPTKTDSDVEAPPSAAVPAPWRPQLRQLALQFAATFTVLSLAWPYFGIRNEALPWPQTALAIGAVAFALATLTRQRWWWRLIHALFAPMAWIVSLLAIDPGWFLLAFIILLLVYRGALAGQIPLYLSSRATATALAQATRAYPGMRFIDLGAGVGSVLCSLSKTRPDARLSGIENAPATWLAGYLLTRRLPDCTWRWGDFWQIDLGAYDVVYAFLSPAPMPELWEKIRREMRPGSLFISNSFDVPDVASSVVVDVEDARGTRLYCYAR